MAIIAFGAINTILAGLSNATLSQHIKYISRANNYVQQLKADMETLSNLSMDIQGKIDLATRDGNHQSSRVIQGLLISVKEVKSQVDAIVTDYDRRCRCMGTYSVDVVSIYSIGKRANNKIAEVNRLIGNLRDDKDLVQPSPPPIGQEFLGTSDLVGTKSNLDKILSYLYGNDEKISRIGIYGMGGVGKTKLLKCVNNDLCNSKEIDHVIWIVVSREFLIKELQSQIAKNLSIELDEKANETSRASSILNFLKNKRYILLLDDVWKFLDLDKLGIDQGGLSNGSKVIFTTRSFGVCSEMRSDKWFKVELLNEAESWELFEKNLGKRFIESATKKMIHIANQVAEECGGLPLALIVIGRHMSTKISQEACRVLLDSIKNSKVKNTGIEEGLYDILKHSYDGLQDEKLRQCFLFCSFFPEDFTFPKEELIEEWFYNGVIDIDEHNDIGAAFDYASSIIDSLVSACLIERNDGWVISLNMHDVIRDMTLWIARQFGQNEFKWSSERTSKSYLSLKRNNVWNRIERLFILNDTDMEELILPSTICPNLVTLFVRGNERLTSIPSSTFSLFPALSYLDLRWTRTVHLPDEIGKLSELQYLNLTGTDIESLRGSLGPLKKLKFLILGHTFQLKYIAPGLISQFEMLRVLDLQGSSFVLEESSSESSKVLDLKELASLQNNLISLSLTIQSKSALEILYRLFSKAIWDLGLRKLEGVNTIDLASTRARTRELDISNCPDLGLIRLPKSAEIMLPFLCKVEIHGCPKLKDVNWVRQLPSLELLSIMDCEGMQEIINCGKMQGVVEEVEFPALRLLNLYSLPELHSICNQVIHCPSLTYVFVVDCRLLQKLTFDFQRMDTNHRPIIIYCEFDWWNNLQWENDDHKSYFKLSKLEKL